MEEWSCVLLERGVLCAGVSLGGASQLKSSADNWDTTLQVSVHGVNRGINLTPTICSCYSSDLHQ